MRQSLILPALLLLLAACGPGRVERPPADAPASSGDCGAADYQWLVGQNQAAVTLPEDFDARILPPDAAVTMDFRPDRLNVVLDDAGNVVRVYCG